uniref:Small ribosomal subunit protein eS31 domain-containing protein n=1 Tax=Ananas comosus var. bracteatus TaxID=296719 RepID=A0A6V7NWN3_ANACO|nr:unnamed protein product [Ananas comosus var. bracteatus]
MAPLPQAPNPSPAGLLLPSPSSTVGAYDLLPSLILRKECPNTECRAGTFMANHFDRHYCGNHELFFFDSPLRCFYTKGSPEVNMRRQSGGYFVGWSSADITLQLTKYAMNQGSLLKHNRAPIQGRVQILLEFWENKESSDTLCHQQQSSRTAGAAEIEVGSKSFKHAVFVIF